jgi:hypothetical protein
LAQTFGRIRADSFVRPVVVPISTIRNYPTATTSGGRGGCCSDYGFQRVRLQLFWPGFCWTIEFGNELQWWHDE